MVSTNYVYNITISGSYFADRANLFILHPKLDWFHDDTINLTIDANGLLATLTTSNADRTGGVMISLAQTAIQSFELAASGGLSGLGAVPAPNQAKFAMASTNDADSWDQLATHLAELNQTYHLGLNEDLEFTLTNAVSLAKGKAMDSNE